MPPRRVVLGLEADAARDDAGVLVFSERAAEFIAARMAHRFHAIAQKAKGGAIGPDGQLTSNPVVANQWGGKGIIKYNPSNDEQANNIRQQQSLLVWQSPDGLPHYVTIEVGRVSGALGGPNTDDTQPLFSNLQSSLIGGVAGSTFPSPHNAAGNPYYYRASAQITLGTPGTMQDPFYIDINRGQRFSALASYVAITAQMNTPPIDSQTNTPLAPNHSPGGLPYVSGSLTVYATLGMEIAPSLAPVLYTQYIDNNTSGALVTNSYMRIVPPRANILLPVYSSGQSDSMQLAFYDVWGQNIGTTVGTGFSTGPAAFPMPVFLPTDCYAIRLITLANQVNNYRLIYQLSV